MKCDLKTAEVRDGEELYPQCSRERIGILPTPFGRLGLCEPCMIFVKDALEEMQEDRREAKGKPMGKVVDLGSGAKGRKAPDQPIWWRRGQVVCAELPRQAE